jgi:hypothetical protein
MPAAIDITGQAFGRLIVKEKTCCPLKFASTCYRRRTWWVCECTCGQEVVKPASILLRGNARSCGCLRAEVASVTAKSRSSRCVLGQRFGRLEVRDVGRPPADRALSKDYSKATWWLCRCDCGQEKSVIGAALLRGHTKSCGCIARRDLPMAAWLPEGMSGLQGARSLTPAASASTPRQDHPASGRRRNGVTVAGSLDR